MSADARPCPLCGRYERRLRYYEDPFRIVRCLSCQFVFLENPPGEESLYEEYYADPSPENFGSGDPVLAELFAINQQRAALISSFRAGGRLLDIGCGRGFFLRTALERGFRAEGIDVSRRAVDFANRIAGVRASTDSLDTLAERGERYTIITAWHVVEHFLNPVEELAKIRKLLGDDGELFVEVPNLRSMRFMLARAKWRGGDHPRYHRSFFDAGTLRKALMRGGFSRMRRIPLSYRLQRRNRLYETGKRVLNSVALDSFLCFRAGP